MNIPGAKGDYWRNGGNELLLENIPMKEDDLVIDGGGFEGIWTKEMLVRYGCKSIIFEPIPQFFKNLSKIFKNNKLVTVYQQGLGGSNRSTEFCISADGSSEYISNSEKKSVVQIIDLSGFLEVAEINNVAVLKLNIEGGEYEVLERLIENFDLPKIRCLLIQFHPTVDGWSERRDKIRRGLESTHNLVWSFDMVWEKWILSDLK
jgi:FkbM family methyltransferase